MADARRAMQPDLQIPLSTTIRPSIDRTGVVGEGTFTHAGTPYYLDDDGIYQTIGANTQRFERPGGTGAKIISLHEPAHKNLIPWFTAFSNWTTSDVSIAANITGPDGGANTATTITDDNVAANDYIFIAVNLETDAEKYAYTIHAQEGTSGDFTLILRDTGAAATRAEIDFEWTGGVLSVKSEDTGTGDIKQLGSTDWWRCKVYVPASVIIEANTHEVWVFPTENGRQAAETTIFWGADLIEHAVEMSPVLTTGSAASMATEEGMPYYDIPLQGGTRVEQYDDAVWVKTDPGGVIENDGNLITVNGFDRDVDGYYTKDMGTDFFGDFVHQVDINVTALMDVSGPLIAVWAVANLSDDLNDISALSGDALFILARRKNVVNYRIQARTLNAGSVTSINGSDTSIPVGTKVFLSISRIGTTFTVNVYSTSELRLAGSTGDIDTMSGTAVGTTFRYVYAIASQNTGGTELDISGTIENLRIGTHSEIFETKTGQELVSNGAFANIDLAAAKVITGITQANPGVVTVESGTGYIKGQVVFIEDLDEMTGLNNEYWKFRNPDSSGADILAGFDFTSGWATTNATINDADTFTTTAAGGNVRKLGTLIDGRYYKVVFVGTASVGNIQILNGDASVVLGTGDGTYFFKAIGTTSPRVQGLIEGAVIDVTTFETYEVNTFELSNAGIATWDTSSLDTSGFAAETTGGTGKVVSFANWIEGDGWHPGVDGAGALTGTADCDGEQSGSSSFTQFGYSTTVGSTKSVFVLSNRADGSMKIQFNSVVVIIRSSDGTFAGYIDKGTEDALTLRGDIDFIGSIDDVSVREVLNAGGVPEYTFVVGRWRPGYAAFNPPTDIQSGIISTRDSVNSIIRNKLDDTGTHRFISIDTEANIASKDLTWVKDTDYKLAVKVWLESNVLYFAVGAEEIGSTFDSGSWGPPTIFSGSFVVSGNEFQIGFGLFGPFWIGGLQLFLRILSDPEIDAL